MKRVIIESPYFNKNQFIQKENILYAEKCMMDSVSRGESPFASHLLYTRILDDNKKEERELGLMAAKEWIRMADLMAVYLDRGETKGMSLGIIFAMQNKIPIKYRRLF